MSEIFVRNLSEMHKKASEIKLSENKSSKNLTSEIFIEFNVTCYGLWTLQPCGKFLPN